MCAMRKLYWCSNLVCSLSVILCLDVNLVSKHNPRSEGIFGGRVGRRPWGRTARERGVSSKDLLVFPCVWYRTHIWACNCRLDWLFMTSIIVVWKYEIKSRCNTGTTLCQKGLTDLLTKIWIFNAGRLSWCQIEDKSDASLSHVDTWWLCSWHGYRCEDSSNGYRQLLKVFGPNKGLWKILTILKCIHHRFSPANSSETIWNIRPYFNSAHPSWHILPFFLFPHSESTGGLVNGANAPVGPKGTRRVDMAWQVGHWVPAQPEWEHVVLSQGAIY